MKKKLCFLGIFILLFTFTLFLPDIIQAASKPLPVDGSSSNEPCPNNRCDTAIGQIDVSSPVGVVMRIFSTALSVGAMGALILIIYSGYKFLTSRANKEAVQGARETLTSAIVGLIFIVFSLVILSVIAGDIIKIPGFN